MARPTVVRWKVLSLTLVASAVAYVLRLNVSIAGPAMIKDLGLSEIQLGIVLSAFAWGYAIFQLPGGLLGEAWGARRGLAAIMAAWGVLTIVMGLIPAAGALPTMVVLAALVVLRFLQGAAQAPLYPISTGAVVPRWFPQSKWAVPNGMQTSALTIGAAAAGPVITWLVLTAGWRQSFLICAPIAFASAALWWWYVRDDPSAHRGVNAEELEYIGSENEPESGVQHASGSWKHLLVHRDLMLLTLSYFCMNYLFYLFFNWFFFYLTDVRHLPAQSGGWFTSAQWMVGAVAATAGGVVCDRLSRRYGSRWGCRITSMAALLLAAPLLLAGSLVENHILAVALLSASFGCTQATDAAYWVAAMTMAGKHAPAATGVLNTGGNIVGGIGALLVPVTAAAFGWVAAIGTGAVAAILAALLWIWIRADPPAAVHDGRPIMADALAPAAT